MAITFVDSTTQDALAATSLTFTIPAGAQADDLILVCVKQSQNTAAGVWDDDGGGGRGYVRLDYNRSTSGRDQETAIYYKIHSGSETNPTFTHGTSTPMSGSMLIYRGVDTVTPIADNSYQFFQNDANPPIPSVNVSSPNSWVVAFQAATHDDISTVAPPTGFTLRTQVWAGTSNDHRNHFTADIDRGANTGNYTPPDWQHSVLNTTPESHSYAVVLQEIQPIGVTNVTPDQTNFSSSVTISGFGFGATQGTGKVELWSDLSGTTKVLQTISNWADGQVDITTVQGALTNDNTYYLVVTNDSGDESLPSSGAITFGLPPYSVVIANQAPDHWWTFDNTYADTGDFGGSPFTNTGSGSPVFVAEQISEGTTQSWNPNGGRREAPNSTRMNSGTSTERCFGGWFMPKTVFTGLTCVFEEGGGVNNLCFLMGIGNRLIASFADTGDDNAQVFSDFPLEVNRAYHIMFRFSYGDNPSEWRMYIDGVRQSVDAGNPLTATDLDSHTGDISIGGGGGNLEVAGTDIAFVTVSDARYSNWYSWQAVNRTEAQILDLFRRGAVPGVDIFQAPASSMEIFTPSTLNDTVFPNEPLNVRIPKPIGSSDLSVSITDAVFPEESSIWVEWRGDGTLTWTNLGTSNLRADKVYTSGGGTVNIINPAQLSLTGIQNPSEVRIYEAGTQNEIAGQENVTTGTFSTSVEVNAVDIVILSLGFQNLKIENVDTSSGDVGLPIQQVIDRQYENN